MLDIKRALICINCATVSINCATVSINCAMVGINSAIVCINNAVTMLWRTYKAYRTMVNDINIPVRSIETGRGINLMCTTEPKINLVVENQPVDQRFTHA
jgi:hypothetical protein